MHSRLLKAWCSIAVRFAWFDVASQLVQRRREVSYDFAINLAREQNKHLLRSMTTSGNKQLITGQRSTTLLMPQPDRCNLCGKIGLKSEWKGVNLRLCAHIICGYFLPRAWSNAPLSIQLLYHDHVQWKSRCTAYLPHEFCKYIGPVSLMEIFIHASHLKTWTVSEKTGKITFIV